MPTKLGWFVEDWTPGAFDTVMAAGGAGLKVMVPDVAPVQRFLEENPTAYLVARKFHPDQGGYLYRREQGGRDVAAIMEASFGHFRELVVAGQRLGETGRFYVEGLNETGLWDDADEYNEFTAGFADECRRRGLQPAIFTFSTGTPPGYVGDGSPADLWAYLRNYEDGIRACQAAGGAIVLNEYDYPTIGANWTWHPLRYRRFYAALLEQYRSIPLIIGETGLDHGVVGGVDDPKNNAGWRAARNLDGSPATEQEYAAGLELYDDALLKDRQVLFAAIFQAGGYWPSFHVGRGPITDMIHSRRMTAEIPPLPADIDPPAPTPEPTPQPPALVDAALQLCPGARRPASKARVWEWWPRTVRETATYRPHLSPGDVVLIANGVQATMWCESDGDPAARGDWRTLADGSRYACSRGLLMLNTCGGAGSRLIAELSITVDDLDEPAVQYLHARALITALEAELYWSRQEGRSFNPGKAIQSVQRSSADPTGDGYLAAYHLLLAEAEYQTTEEIAMVIPETTIGNAKVYDLRLRFPSGYSQRPLSAIGHISIHHSATPTLPETATIEQEIAALDAIYRYHTETKGWPGIAYHLVCFPSGRRYWVSAWDTTRYLIGDRNRETLGVLLHGDFTHDPPGSQQLTTVAILVDNIRYQLGNGALPIFPHREVASEPTACPGATWAEWRDAIEPSPDAPEEPTSEVDPVRVQLDVLYALRAHLPAERAEEQRLAVIALKEHLGLS